MKLEKFVWNNGTKDKPIVLTDDEINTLLELKKQDNIEFNVSGYITTSTNKIQKYLKYEIEQAYPNLTITAQVINDNITIGLRSTNINEGESIICYNTAIGLELKYIRCKFTHKINITYGTIDEQSIIDSVSYNHNNYTIATQIPRFNASWTDEVTAKFYPFYEDSSTTNAITLKFTIKAIAIENIQFALKDKYYVDSKQIKFTYKYLPISNTKADYITKELFINGVKTNNLSYYNISKKEDITIKCNIYLFNKKELELEKTVSVVERKIDIYKMYNSDNILTINKIKKYKIYDNDNLVIEDIRKNITFWRGNITLKSFAVKQVSTKDLSKYEDGTEITDYDNNDIYTFTNYNGFAYKFEYDEDSLENSFGIKDILIYITADIEELSESEWNIIPKNYFITTHSVYFTKQYTRRSYWHHYNESEHQFSSFQEKPYYSILNNINSTKCKAIDQTEVEYIILLYWLWYELNNCYIGNSNSLTPNDEALDEYGNENIIFDGTPPEQTVNVKYSNFFGLVNILTGYCLNYSSFCSSNKDAVSNKNHIVYNANVFYRNTKFNYKCDMYRRQIAIFEIKNKHIVPVLPYLHDGEESIKYPTDDKNKSYSIINNIYMSNISYISSLHCTGNTYNMNNFLNFYSAETWSSKTRLYYQGDYKIIE